MLTNHRDVVYAQTDCSLVPWTCADGSSMNFKPVPIIAEATPLTASSAWTLLPDYWQVWQRTDLASRYAWGSVASASTYSTVLSKRTALSCRLFNNASSMAWGSKATLLCAHSPTVLTNPEPCSACRLSLHPRCAFIATGCIQDAYPCPHVMTRTI